MPPRNSFVDTATRAIDARIGDAATLAARPLPAHGAVAVTTATTAESSSMTTPWQINLTSAIDHLRAELDRITASPPADVAPEVLADSLHASLTNHLSVRPPRDSIDLGSATAGAAAAAHLLHKPSVATFRTAPEHGGRHGRHDEDDDDTNEHHDPTESALYAEFEALTWLYLAKAAAAVFAQQLNASVRSALLVRCEAEWWREVSPAWYLAMTLPLRLPALSPDRNPWRHMLPTSPLRRLFSRTSFLTLASPLSTLQSLGRPMSFADTLAAVRINAVSPLALPLRRAADEITAHLNALEAAEKSAARVIGTLYAHTLEAPRVVTRDEVASSSMDALAATVGGMVRVLERALLPLDATVARGSIGGNNSDINNKNDDSDEEEHFMSPTSPTRHHVSTRRSPSPLSASETLSRLLSLASSLEPAAERDQSLVAAHARPGWLVRTWLPVTVGVVALTVAVGDQQSLRDLAVSATAAARSAAAFVRNAVRDWLVAPAVQVYETVRHREHRLAVVGARSVAADLESLERMVVEYARRHDAAGSAASPESLAVVRAGVRDGDLGPVMRDYERGVMAPVRSAVAGELVTLMLIQVQKSKVDLELAMAALDKLLKSNELNFAMLALLPTAMLAWVAVRGVSGWVGSRVSGGAHTARRRFVRALWAVSRADGDESVRLGYYLFFFTARRT
ncbi:ATP synthase regulation protein NCA2-domain-containing protein, partial [Blastocladiella britannica]